MNRGELVKMHERAFNAAMIGARGCSTFWYGRRITLNPKTRRWEYVDSRHGATCTS